MAGFEEIADELYGLPPEEFTAARTRYEKEAKAAGARDEAARIHSLAKPTVTAWLANQLARSHHEELEPLLELGAGLRDGDSQPRRRSAARIVATASRVGWRARATGPGFGARRRAVGE